MVTCGGEHGGECGLAGGEVVGMADVVGVREVARGVCRDQDVRLVFSDHADDFTTQRDRRFEVAVREVQELDRLQAEDTSGVGLFLFSDLA